MKALSAIDVPCGPILSTKDIIEDRSLYERGFLVEVPHPERGNYVTVASPIQLSDSPVEWKGRPAGEHTERCSPGSVSVPTISPTCGPRAA